MADSPISELQTSELRASDLQSVILAVDLGASGGRIVAGKILDGKLSLDVVHRFPNGGIRIAGRLHWDLPALWQHIKDGLRLAASQYGDAIVSLGVDTWGVDFALLGTDDTILGNPFHYRDEHTNGIVERALQIVRRSEIFQESGLQFMQINSLFQLHALKQAGSPLLEAADSFLMMPDLFHWLLTGVKANEQTIASTTQFYNPKTRDWSRTLLERFDLPTGILHSIVTPGTKLGPLLDDVAGEIGMQPIDVIVPGTHDTASAIMAVPAEVKPGVTDWCYISSGTWSLMGVELPAPAINDRTQELNFTNEAGVGNTTRLLKNIAGMWLIQECRRIRELQGEQIDFADMVDRAEQSQPLIALIDPDDESLIAPEDMQAAIRDFCRNTGQQVPESNDAVVRCALESLALRYREVLSWLEEIVGNRIETIHIVGGGTQNELLCQMAADACNRTVIAGPVEATAIGNVLMQAVSLGIVDSISQARELARNSFDVVEYQPTNVEPWNEAYQRYLQMKRT